MIGFAESTVSAFEEKVELGALHSYAGHGCNEQLDRAPPCISKVCEPEAVQVTGYSHVPTYMYLCQGDLWVPRALTTSTVPDVRCDRSGISSTLGINNTAVSDIVAKVSPERTARNVVECSALPSSSHTIQSS